MSGEAQVTVRLDPASPHVGDLISFDVTLLHPKESKPNAPVTRDGIPLQPGSSFGGLEVVSALPPVREKAPGDGLETRFRYILRSFSTGKQSTPDLVIRLSGTKEKLVEVPGQVVEVASLLAKLPQDKRKTADIQAIKGPLPVAPDYTAWWLLLGCLLVLLLLIHLVRKLLARRKEAKTAASPPVPPYEEAIAALDALKARELPRGGGWKEFALAISMILRRYLERRYGFPGTEMTSREVLRALSSQAGFDGRLLGELRNLFEETDLVKFARQTPPLSAENDLLAAAHLLLEETRVPGEVEQESKEAA